MNASDEPKFNARLATLAAVVNFTITAEVASEYFAAMREFELPAVEWAFRQAMRECQFFPKPVELRAMATKPERYHAQPDSRTFQCLRCHDTGLIITARKTPEGQDLGLYGAPCRCDIGIRKREAWLTPNAKGECIADEAKRNTAMLVERGAIAPLADERIESNAPTPVERTQRPASKLTDQEYGDLAVAAMARIGEVGVKQWLADEIANPSSGDPRWVHFVANDIAQRWG